MLHGFCCHNFLSTRSVCLDSNSYTLSTLSLKTAPPALIPPPPPHIPVRQILCNVYVHTDVQRSWKKWESERRREKTTVMSEWCNDFVFVIFLLCQHIKQWWKHVCEGSYLSGPAWKYIHTDTAGRTQAHTCNRSTHCESEMQQNWHQNVGCKKSELVKYL